MDQKKTKQKKVRGVILWLVCLVLLVVAGAGTFAVLNVIFKKDEKVAEVNNTPEVEKVEEIETVGEAEIDEIEDESVGMSGEESDETNAGKKVTQYEGEDPNKLDELTGVITMASVQDGVLVIRTNIDQYLSSGSCELSVMQNGSIIYSATADIGAGVSTSSCQGFDVPATVLGSGNYQINIKISSGGKTGTLNGEVNV